MARAIKKANQRMLARTLARATDSMCHGVNVITPTCIRGRNELT